MSNFLNVEQMNFPSALRTMAFLGIFFKSLPKNAFFGARAPLSDFIVGGNGNQL